MDNQSIYDNIFCETFEVDKAALNDSFTFQNIETWDSVAHISMISKLEDAFDVMFDSTDILHKGWSYQFGIEVLKRYGVEF